MQFVMRQLASPSADRSSNGLLHRVNVSCIMIHTSDTAVRDAAVGLPVLYHMNKSYMMIRHTINAVRDAAVGLPYHMNESYVQIYTYCGSCRGTNMSMCRSALGSWSALRYQFVICYTLSRDICITYVTSICYTYDELVS